MALFADAFEDALRPMHDARRGNALAKVWDKRARGEAARVVGAVIESRAWPRPPSCMGSANF